jgi:pantoate--beta-alanine ligase
MGEKDFQQIFLVKKFYWKRFNTKIIGCKTIRNKNKLALSSRKFFIYKKRIKSSWKNFE